MVLSLNDIFVVQGCYCSVCTMHSVLFYAPNHHKSNETLAVAFGSAIHLWSTLTAVEIIIMVPRYMLSSINNYFFFTPSIMITHSIYPHSCTRAGIALAVVANVKKYKSVFVMPEKMSDEKVLLVCNAQILLCSFVKIM